jgi:hypothetical protein
MANNDGDEIAFGHAMQDTETTVLFKDKNYNFITDSSSNSGNFSSGQIQFDLSTLASQSSWTSLAEAVIEIPIKTTITIGSWAPATGSVLPSVSAIVHKAGFHQYIDGCQLMINGQTIQSMSSFENVAATYRILSSWSQDTLKKWGTATNFALDDCTGDASIPGNSVAATGLSQAAYATVAPAARGFDPTNNQATIPNRGFVTRATNTNIDISTSGSLMNSTLGAAGVKGDGMSNVAFVASGTAGATVYSAFALATVRLKDICDIKDLPPVKNLKGFLYLTYNSSQTTVTCSGNTVSSFSTVVQSGRTCPINHCVPATLASGAPGAGMGYSVTVAAGAWTYVVTTGVDGTNTSAISPSAAISANARLLCPSYDANPKTDAALSRTAKFSTFEKIVNPIICPAGQSVNVTITAGVANARRLVLLPMWQNMNTSTTPNPEQSIFDTCPATSGVFASLNQLQVYLANKPCYQYPINYNFEQWLMENSQVGANGSMVNEMTSGLLTKQLFEQNHRFYTVDLSRRMESEDGMSKSVIVQFTNPGTLSMKVIAILFYEKFWTLQSDTCTLSSSY